MAVEAFNEGNVDLVLHLGDIIEKNETEEQTRKDFDDVMSILDDLRVSARYVLGNHCLDCGREHATKKLGLTVPPYGKYDVNDQWRIVILDTMQCAIKFPPSETLFEEAKEYLKTHEADENAKGFNGGLGRVQLQWLKECLESSRMERKSVIICGHHPISPQSAPAMLLLWDNSILLKLFEQFNDVIVAYFCGHFHRGGYSVVDSIHHITFESILESEDESGSFAFVELHQDHVVISGKGDLTSRVLHFSPLTLELCN